MRTILLMIILLSPVAALFNAALHGRRLEDFLSKTPRLESSRDLEAFKRLAAGQMRAALVQAALLAPPPLCFFWGVTTGALAPSDFVWVLLPSIIVIFFARSIRGLERRAWSIEANGETLTAQRDHVVRTWRTRALPDW